MNYTNPIESPTSIFGLGSSDISWFNLYGLFALLILLLPNIIFALRAPKTNIYCDNKFIAALEQIGRFGSMFCMVFGFGFNGFNVLNVNNTFFYRSITSLLLIAYWSLWLVFSIERKPWNAIALAVVPTTLFLHTGIFTQYPPLIIFAIIFGIGHISTVIISCKRANLNHTSL